MDGRPKPDLVAPTNTLVAGPSGPRAVGGTSNAAPNAAGAVAALLSSQRAAGLAPTAEETRATLAATALDLGDPGPDPLYGAGRVRVDVDPPEITPLEPLPGAIVRGVVMLQTDAADGSPVARWSLAVDGAPIADRHGEPGAARLDTRGLADGPHAVLARAWDWPGNMGERAWQLEVDNTPPALGVPAVEVLGSRPPRLRGPAEKGARAARRAKRLRLRPRAVRVVVAASDAAGGPLTLVVRLADRRGREVAERTLRMPSSTGRRIALGRMPGGLYRLALELTDRAGNVRRLARAVVVR